MYTLSVYVLGGCHEAAYEAYVYSGVTAEGYMRHGRQQPAGALVTVHVCARVYMCLHKWNRVCV